MMKVQFPVVLTTVACQQEPERSEQTVVRKSDRKA
jgi:hypothetical protein